MTKTELINWLKLQQVTLDTVIAGAAKDFHTNATKSRAADLFGFDLAECQAESWNLRDGKDLCYDRPNTPFVYSLWYHARRINTFLTHFIDSLYDSQNLSTLEVFDLGAGTGAVQWAIGLVYHKMKSMGLPFPKIRIVNVDTSPFMLYYGKNYLWKHFIAVYHHCNDFAAEIIYNVNSWNNQQKMSIRNPWITASYLFDISDNSPQGDYKKAVLKSFQHIVNEYDPSKFLLLTALAKEQLIDNVSKEFDHTKYLVQKVKSSNLMFQGDLPIVNTFRKALFERYKPFLNSYREASLKNEAAWHDNSFVGTVITKRQAEIFNVNTSTAGLELHITPIKSRVDVNLNEEQKKAAKNVNQPTVIIGPAGCGKSIVITERINNIVNENSYDPKLRILLTTFNIGLLGQLKQWVIDLLQKDKILNIQNGSQGTKIFFVGNSSANENIRILHFDMLPKYLGGVPYWGLVSKEAHNKILSDIILRVKLVNKVIDDRYDNILNPVFLQEEYYRVIYGLQVGIQGSKDSYLGVSRKGRGVALEKSRRELVWQCLEPYANYIYTKKIPSFVLRRQLFLNFLENGQINLKFDHVIVDEFQDCTMADFEIFFYLLRDPNNLVIAGDLAQAVHLGKSANVESLRGAIRGDRVVNDINWNYLDGSYRLPFRVCEAIKKISEHIHLSFKKNHAARILTPYKGAPPGPRPIVVIGKDEKELALKIRQIMQEYKIFGIEDSCILENDYTLGNLLQIESDSVLRLKGLEKQCVIWSTRVSVENRKEKFEFVYTILSRTSCLLIIVLFDQPNGTGITQNVYGEIIGLLDRDRIIFWDKHTKDMFGGFCEVVNNATEIEEV